MLLSLSYIYTAL